MMVMTVNLLMNQMKAEAIDEVYQDLETRLMQNIARHLRDWNKPIDSDRWQLQKLAELGKLNQENIQIITQMSGISQTAAERMLMDTADEVTNNMEKGFRELARRNLVNPVVAVRKSDNMNQAMDHVLKQAKDRLNLCNTTMLYKSRDAYKNLVAATVKNAKIIEGCNAATVITGVESRQQALRNAIKQFNDRGITAFVDKAGREWTPEAYISMTMRTTVAHTADTVQEAKCKDYDINLISIDSHSGARPKCAKDQGKIFDLNNNSGYTEDLNGKKIRYYPWKSSSYGEPDGLLGINCRHHRYPFIPGVNIQRYFPTDDLDANNKLYKQTQVQRAFERDVRKQKRECMLYSELGDDEAFEKASIELKNKETKLKNYVNEHPELHRRKNREQVIGFDKKISSNAVVAYKGYTKAQNTDKIPIKDIIIHKSVGAKYRNYKVVNKDTGVEYEFAHGTRIQDSEIFAGKGTKRPLHEGVAEGLSERYGGTPSKWQHAKGHGVLVDKETGEEFEAEVHWFQEETVGKVGFKLKKEL